MSEYCAAPSLGSPCLASICVVLKAPLLYIRDCLVAGFAPAEGRPLHFPTRQWLLEYYALGSHVPADTRFAPAPLWRLSQRPPYVARPRHPEPSKPLHLHDQTKLPRRCGGNVTRPRHPGPKSAERYGYLSRRCRSRGAWVADSVSLSLGVRSLPGNPVCVLP